MQSPMSYKNKTKQREKGIKHISYNLGIILKTKDTWRHTIGWWDGRKLRIHKTQEIITLHASF